GNHRFWISSSSYAEDRYLPPAMTFPNILERLLTENGVNAVVLNASRAGSDIPANVSDLRRLGEQWKPDYVILYQMSLTIGAITKVILTGNRAQGDPGFNQPVKGNGPISWVNKFVEKTTTYENVKGQIAARIGANRVLSNDIGDRGEQVFSSFLQEFVEAT